MEFFSHCVKQDEKGLHGRATGGMLIILLALSLLGWIYLNQASHVITTGRKVRELEVELRDWRAKNLELQAEIAGLESVRSLAERADALGFVQATPQESSYLLVQAVPEFTEEALDDGSVVTRLWDNVATQLLHGYRQRHHEADACHCHRSGIVAYRE